MEMTINHEQRLYVMECGTGYTCLGFDVAERKIVALWQWMRDKGFSTDAKPTAELGTEAHFAVYNNLMAAAARFCEANGIRCDVELSPQLTGLEGRRVEVTDDAGEVRRFNVGKSTGWMPCHLEIARRGCYGGMAAMGPYKSVRVVR